MKKYSLAIFDMDGLMFDSERISFEIMKDVLSKHGYTYTLEMYVESVGTNNEVARKIITKQMPKDFPYVEMLEKVEKELIEYTDKNPLPMKKGLIELLDFLKQNKVVCCIASSSPTTTIVAYLNKVSLSDYFSFYVGGNQVERTKPYPDIFLKALELGNVNADEAVVFEDSENGVLASHRASIDVIVVPDLKYPNRDILNKALCFVSSLDQIIKLMQ